MTRRWASHVRKIAEEIERTYGVVCSTYPNHGYSGNGVNGEPYGIDAWISTPGAEPTQAQRAKGSSIAAFTTRNWSRLGVVYLIWNGYWTHDGKTWKKYNPEIYDNPLASPDPTTTNHRDHCHLQIRMQPVPRITEPPYSYVPAHPMNYTRANRTADDVWLAVIHQTQSPAGDRARAMGDANWFANPQAGTSAHDIIGADGTFITSVMYRDIAWHAGNWSVNMASIGIEIDGYTNVQDTPEVQYRKAAHVLRFASELLGIPLVKAFDPGVRRVMRAGVLGHMHVPGATHTDPGSGFDFNKLLAYAREL